MPRQSGILDQWGRPIVVETLKQEVAGPTVTGVRSPITGYPGDGLNPQRLAAILREADRGDPLRYLELAETVEERDAHYLGVLGTRKRSVAQLEITVETGSDAPEHEAQAEDIREWLKRDELQDELFSILDAVGKGYSFTEIVWDSSAGDWWPERLEWRDPRWFRFHRRDGRTPLLIGDGGQEQELPGFKFISALMSAKSGITPRSGLARVVTWAWMFKAFTQRDWAIFTQTYGQPIRVGKYGPGATEQEKATLYRAVANIAGDCAAIIPQSMVIEFIESGSVATSHQLYKERSDWLDQQVSKAVLGQTATTDAIAGGHAVGQEHRQVQEDIERADARALAAVLNRDLVRPWIILNHGPQDAYPRMRIGRAEIRDMAAIVDAVAALVPLGLKVRQSEMLELTGLSRPEEDDELLAAPAPALPSWPGLGAPRPPVLLPRPDADDRESLHGAQPGLPRPEDVVTDAALRRAAAPAAAMIDALRGTVERAGSLEELRTMLRAAEPGMSEADLALVMRQAMLVAELAGRAELADG